MHRIEIIDSHTAGEPTRVVVAGGPDLGDGPIGERRARFAAEFDAYRRAIINEPRGSDVIVGALLGTPTDASCVASVIFFNNVGYIGMCGHGTIGVGVTLAHLGRIAAGRHALETLVGRVEFEYDGRHGVALQNVASYRSAANVELNVEGVGRIRGDVAWGGNWFFLAHDHQESLEASNTARLTEATLRIRAALRAHNIRGDDGGEIDHIELFAPPRDPRNHSRNFVLCPGGAYDRSPCGTGTSAKLACLAADRKLAPGEVWRQESILGTVFEASYRPGPDGRIVPRIAGEAFLTAQATLLIEDDDPLGWGIGP